MLALGPGGRYWKPRSSQPFHMAELIVKPESWKFRFPEHDLTKEILLLEEILAGSTFTGNSRHWSELSRTAGDWRLSLLSRHTKLVINEIQTEE